jgi:hypothetical protein
MRRIPLLVAMLFVTIPAIAVAQPRALGHTVRWDLVQIVQGTALAGGASVARDAATGDTFTLTGSGDAEPAEGDAAGGGTVVHHFSATGVEVHGVYVVTAFISWEPGGGQLAVADGIGHASEASAGVLKMAINIFVPGRPNPVSATLTVNCHLPGATVDVEEGIEFSVGAFDAKQNGGVTLFHVQK